MQKKTHDYDNVFKTMKVKHKRLFVPVINDIFGKNYPLDVKMDVLPSEGYFIENETADGSKEIKEQISDFLIRIGSEVYLLECQSYDDDSMAIRIAEYAFIAARQFALWNISIGKATIPMPRFAVIYVKQTDKTPKTTAITFTFPDGQKVDYKSDNVILEELSREYIIKKKLFPYIPFYIARYEKDISYGNNVEAAVEDLTYFRNEIIRLHGEKSLSDGEMVDLMGFVNTIITHITNGNKNEERLVEIMGGVIIETQTEKWMRQGMQQGEAKMLIKLGQKDGLSDATILDSLQKEMELSLETAKAYLEQYGKQFV